MLRRDPAIGVSLNRVSHSIIFSPMIHFICKSLHGRKPVASTKTLLCLFTTLIEKSKSSISNSSGTQSPTVSYLLNSCGLSLESSILASKKIQFESTEKQDLVLKILKTHGLTQSHIKDLVIKFPLLLLADPNKTLKPNIELLRELGISGADLVKVLNKYPKIIENAHSVVEFFRANGFSDKQIYTITKKWPVLYQLNLHKVLKPKLEFFVESLGFSEAEIAQILYVDPFILGRSLDDWIRPSVQAIKRIVGTDMNVRRAIKAFPYMLNKKLEEVFLPNMAVLMDHGVPVLRVSQLISLQPRSLFLPKERFSEVVREVDNFNFDPTKLRYILAIRTMAVMDRSIWERKLELYGSFGLSEDEIISAFKLLPMCLLPSENKIKELMGFFVNELKLKPSMILKNPEIMLFSLEKRIIPRCKVLQLLMSKDLIKKISLVHAITMTKNRFEERFVKKNQHVISEVAEIYEGKRKLPGFSPQFKHLIDSSV